MIARTSEPLRHVICRRPNLPCLRRAGDALDKQLYVEGWRPDRAEQLQAALDVASGMNYLHTFSQCANLLFPSRCIVIPFQTLSAFFKPWRLLALWC